MRQPKVKKARITVLHGLPHFLFWYKLNKKGEPKPKDSQKHSFSLKNILPYVEKETGFLYGSDAMVKWDYSADKFSSDSVILLEKYIE